MKKLPPDSSNSTPHLELDGWEHTKLNELVWLVKHGHDATRLAQDFERGFNDIGITDFTPDRHLNKWPQKRGKQ